MPRDRNLRSWSPHLIGGKKMEMLGFVEAVSEAAAMEDAVALFGLDDHTAVRARRPRQADTSGVLALFEYVSNSSLPDFIHLSFRSVTGRVTSILSG